MSRQIVMTSVDSYFAGSCSCCSWIDKNEKYVYQITFSAGNQYQSTSLRLCSFHLNELKEAIK